MWAPGQPGRESRDKSRAASESGIGDSVIRVNWQIEDGKEDSSLFSCESILFSLPRLPRHDGPTPTAAAGASGSSLFSVSGCGVWAYLRERVMNRTRNRSQNLLIRI